MCYAQMPLQVTAEVQTPSVSGSMLNIHEKRVRKSLSGSNLEILFSFWRYLRLVHTAFSYGEISEKFAWSGLVTRWIEMPRGVKRLENVSELLRYRSKAQIEVI